MRDYCIKGIAALNSAMRSGSPMNRTDPIPGDCDEAPQGSPGDTLLTPWDPKSVMNYCNSKYNNGGKLSELDQKAVAFIYGVPKP